MSEQPEAAFADFVRGAISEEEWRAMSEEPTFPVDGSAETGRGPVSSDAGTQPSPVNRDDGARGRTSWQPGDRVRVQLPDKSARWAPRTWFAGTVEATDDLGVSVRLDEQVNGVRDCHATREELRPSRSGGLA